MNFPNVQVLSASSKSDFFGDNVRWRTVYEITVEGNFIALTAGNSSSTIHGLVNSFENSAFTSNTFETPISVNGTYFGEGYISNFSSTAEGPDVQNKKYTATAVIRLQGNLNNITNDNLGSVNKSNFQYIENFSESSNFNKGEGVKDSYSQEISFSFNSKAPGSQKSIAETIIKSFLNNNTLVSLIIGQYQKTGIRKYYTQSYDETTNSYSANVSFDLAPRSVSVGNADNLIVTTNVKTEYSPAGIITITEDGECIGNSDTNAESNYNTASGQVKTLIDSAFGRLSGYITGSEDAPLINQPISKNFTGAPFEGRATYSITFTNSKEVIDTKGYWEFTIDIQQTPAGDYTGSESGTITGGKESKATSEKYNLALGIWNSKKTGIKSRISTIISEDGGDISKFEKTATEETHSEINGTINYKYSYSTSTSLFGESENIRKKLVTISKDYDRKIFATFNIVEQKEIAQLQKNIIPNDTTISIVLNGISSLKFPEYLTQAKGLLSSNKPVASNTKLSSLSYEFSPSNRELKLNATYFTMVDVQV